MSMQFSESYYLNNNPDVLQAVLLGWFPNGQAHYNQYGWVEGRDPNANFDTSYYVQNNPDVLQAVLNGDFASPLDHFLAYGANEGRAPSAEAAELLALFDAAAYLDANPDVAEAVAAGDFTAEGHWLLFGQFEDRDGVPSLPPVGENFTLTIGTDAGPAFTGGAGDDVFQADVVQTGLLPNQTLNNTDNLDGGEGWNVLNAQLVDPNVTPAGLSNIQEINISSAPGIVSGLLGLISPRLNAINADSVEVLGFTSLHNDVAIDNLDAGLTDINISNSGPGFFGGNPDIDVNLIGDNLGGEEDELNINLVNADVTLDVDYDGLEDDQGYEVINIDSAGSDPDGNELELEGSALTAHTVNVTGGTDLDMRGSTGLDLEHLRTFTAAALTANLWADFVGAAEDEDGELQTVEITGAEGDNDLSFNDTAGNLVIETFDGDDEITFAGHEGDIDLVTGAGDDEVTINAARFGPGATGEGITIDMGEGDNTLEVSIPALPADQQDALVDGDVALMSFGDADIQNVQTLVVDGDLRPDGNGLGVGANGTIVVDLDGLADIETVEFDGQVTVGNADFIIANAPDELTLTFEAGFSMAGNGSFSIEDVEVMTINATHTSNINGALIFDDLEELTLNVGNEDDANQTFNIANTGSIQADDLETFTVNLINGANFVGPVTAATTVVSLESVVVTGNEDSDFTIVFGEVASPSITSIDLSGFEGSATIDLDEDDPVTPGDIFDPITITIGSGDLDYGTNIGMSSNRETFVFTDGDFGDVTIGTEFTEGSTADGDRLDLSALGVGSAADLNIEDDGTDTTITSDLFDGEITILGHTFEGDANFATFNIIYA